MDFSVHLDPGLVRRALRQRLFKRWPRFLLIFALLLIPSLGDFLGGSGLIGTMGLTVFGMFLLIHAFVYRQQSHAIRRWHLAQGNDPLHYHLDDESVRVTSNLGSNEFKWTVFTSFQISKEFYQLHFLNGGTFTLPADETPAEAVSFIQTKFQALGLPTRQG